MNPIKFSEQHQWLCLNEELVIVGITEYAIVHLGDVVFIEFFHLSDIVSEGDELVVIESEKVVSSVLAPMSGKILEVNQMLLLEPEKIMQDPLGQGWLFKLSPDNLEQFGDYMDEETYQKFIS